MFLIVGLGNPGKEYVHTRHNLGFKVIDELARRLGVKTFKSKCSALIADAKIADHKVLLAQPQTFMNNSGLAVRELMAWFKIGPEKLIVIYDDVDLDAGTLRVREKGNAGGHHGMESVIEHVGTTQFSRVRIGIGRETLIGDVTDYVLQKIPLAQTEILEQAIIAAADAVVSIISK